MLRGIDEREAAEARRGIRAWLLAPTLDLYHALMRGEAIPAAALNFPAIRQYGIRRRNGAP